MTKISNLVQDLNGRIFLPGLQREFVWERDQIELLFDSLIKEYPVGLITRWDVMHSSEDYHAYRFIQNFINDEGRAPGPVKNEGFQKYNDRASENSDPQYLVIDGQQRLTSVFIGLFGKVAEYTKGQGGSRDEPTHWSAYRLCVNLFGHPDFNGGNLSGEYEFEFRRTEDFGKPDNFGFSKDSEGVKRFWYPLAQFMNEDRELKDQSTIRETTNEEINGLPLADEERERMRDIRTTVITDIDSRILDEELPEKNVEQSSEDIKEIFQRMNIEGESPDPYQLLLSRMMSTWPFAEPEEKEINPREKVEEWTETFQQDYPDYEERIDRELFMRYSAFLYDEMLKTKEVRNLSPDDLLEMRELWYQDPSEGTSFGEHSWFLESLKKAIKSLTEIGFNQNSMGAQAMIAAIAVFYYRNPEASETDSENLNSLYRFISRLVFLEKSKNSIGRVEARRLSDFLHDQPTGEFSTFPEERAFDALQVDIARETVQEAIQNARYPQTEVEAGMFVNKNIAAILGLAHEDFSMADVADLEIDHIFPASESETVQQLSDYSEQEFSIHRAGNLQLLESGVNNAKDDKMPADWLDSLGDSEEDEYRRVNSYPQGIDIEPENYKEFVEEREKILLNKISSKIV